MANDRVIAIRITADGKVALAELDKVDKKIGQQPGGLGKLQQSWLGVAAAVTAFAVAAKQAWDMVDATATYYEQVAVLNALGSKYNQTGEQIVNSVKGAARGLVSMADAADMSAKALNLGLNPQQVLDFTRVSEQLTDVIGGTIPQAFERMTVAAASGRTMTLAQMGIMVDLEGAYRKYATANGRTVQSLSETEKYQIRLNAILDTAKTKMNVLGPATDTVKDKMDRLRAQVDDLKIAIGGFIYKGGLALYGLFQGVAAAGLQLYAGLMKIGQATEWLRSKLTFGDEAKMHAAAAQQFKDDAAAAWAAAEDLTRQGSENLQTIFLSNAEVMGAIATEDKNRRDAMAADDIVVAEETAAALGRIAQKAADQQAGLLDYTDAKRLASSMLQKHMAKDEADSTISALGTAFNSAKNYYRLKGVENHKAFVRYKQMAKAEAAVSTAVTAMNVFKSLSSIPYVGYALGVAAAAAVIAYGGKQIAAINAEQPGVSPSVGTHSADSLTGLPTDQQPASAAGPVTNYHIYGTVIGDLTDAARILAPKISEAQADGAH